MNQHDYQTTHSFNTKFHFCCRRGSAHRAHRRSDIDGPKIQQCIHAPVSERARALQRSPLFCAPGLVKFVPTVARLFCLAVPGSFLTMFAQNKGDLCSMSFSPYRILFLARSIFFCGTLPTEIGKKVGLFAKLQPGRARKRINAT